MELPRWAEHVLEDPGTKYRGDHQSTRYPRWQQEQGPRGPTLGCGQTAVRLTSHLSNCRFLIH